MAIELAKEFINLLKREGPAPVVFWLLATLAFLFCISMVVRLALWLF